MKKFAVCTIVLLILPILVGNSQVESKDKVESGQIRYADRFSGGDCGAKIMAAESDLGSTPGVIAFTQMGCGSTIASPISLSTGHQLRWEQGSGQTTSAITLTAPITLGYDSNSFIGCGHRDCVLHSMVKGSAIVWHGDSGSVFGGGTVSGITIDGTGNAAADANGLEFEQIVGATLDDVVIENFANRGQVCLLTSNGTKPGNVEWTERSVIGPTHSVWLNNCAIGWRLTSNGHAGSSSVGYSRVHLELNVNAGQVGIQSENNIRMYSSELNIKFNDTVGGAQTANFYLKDSTSWDHNVYLVASEGGTGPGVVTSSAARLSGCGQFDMAGLHNQFGGSASTGTAPSTFRITPNCASQSLGSTDNSGAGTFYPIMDGGTVTSWDGLPQTVNVEPVLQDSSSPASYFGFGINTKGVESPFVAMYGHGNNAFEVFKTSANSPPSAMVEVARIDNTGNVFAKGNITAAGILTSATGTQKLVADSDLITTGAPGTVEFSWGPMAVNTDFSFHCFMMYQQRSGTGGVGFSVQGAIQPPRRLDAWADIYSDTRGALVGSAVDVRGTAAKSFARATPSATDTTYKAVIDGTIQIGALPSTLNVLAYTDNSSNPMILKAGSYCTLQP